MDNKKIKLNKKYISSEKFINKFYGNLVIFCSDERFVEATIEFIKKHTKRADFFVIAGGTAFWCLNEKENINRLRFLIEKHKIKNIYVFAHQDCGFYKYLYPELTQQEIFYIQISDLIFFKEKIKKEFKQIKKVCLLYIKFENQKIYFLEIQQK